MPADPEVDALPPITELSKAQRRVLGVLVEKALTTPEAYPLTLKAATTGCNQKSNRMPLTEYNEDTVAETLDELRALGLAAVVHTESGRTERYRHYMRRRFTLTEPQLAILTELLLRGSQQLGELRSRASRMVPIESQEQLRDELHGLMQMNLLQANGPLDRRGVEVDHKLYRPQESRSLAGQGIPAEPRRVEPAAISKPAAPPSPASGLQPGVAATPDVSSSATPFTTGSAAPSELLERLRALESAIQSLEVENVELRSAFDTLRDEMRSVAERVDQLCRELGSV